MQRELIIFGTAAQVPTRDRNHNGYFLRWNGSGVLFDPGEGAQRQMAFAEVAASQITHIAITHFHGDHCLGLPGIIQRLSLDKVPHAVHVYFPASGAGFIDAMCNASLYQNNAQLVLHPVSEPGVLFQNADMILRTAPIDHRVDCWGYRVEEPDTRTICMEKLAVFGLQGPQIGALKKEGTLTLSDGSVLDLRDVSEARVGQSFAHVMDTRPCDNAIALARDVDILLTEATFLDSEVKQAHEYMHLTARQAAELALAANAQKLVLSHFSQRYSNTHLHVQQAREVFAQTYAAHDLEHFEFPKRERFTRA